MKKIKIIKLAPYRAPSSGHDGVDGTEIHFEYVGNGFDIVGSLQVETGQENREKYPTLSLKEAYDLLEGMEFKIW